MYVYVCEDTNDKKHTQKNSKPKSGLASTGARAVAAPQRHRHAEDLFVEGDDKDRVEKVVVHNRKCHYTANKLKIQEVVLVESAGGVDLQFVIAALAGLEHAVAWVKDLVGEKKEPLAGQAAVIKSTCVKRLSL
jgi:hypothetical protein